MLLDMNPAVRPALLVIFSVANTTLTLTLEAIMAAEERRKQKEQIKILKQQVGVLYVCADISFSSLLI